MYLNCSTKDWAQKGASFVPNWGWGVKSPLILFSRDKKHHFVFVVANVFESIYATVQYMNYAVHAAVFFFAFSRFPLGCAFFAAT